MSLSYDDDIPQWVKIAIFKVKLSVKYSYKKWCAIDSDLHMYCKNTILIILAHLKNMIL